MAVIFGLESEADSKGWRNEQVARSIAECQEENIKRGDCIKGTGSYLADYAIEHFGAEVIEKKSPSSPGFITFVVNEDKAKVSHLHNITCDNLFYAVMLVGEGNRVDAFLDYLSRMEEKRVLVTSLADGSICKVVKPSDASRYFPGGRRRIKGKIYKRLGRWFNCPGYLLSLTFDPGKVSRYEAWRTCRVLAREFINRVNRWRKRAGMPKAKFLSCLEMQPGTGYPHIHIVFPYLRWLAPIGWMTEQWGQAENSVDYKVKDSISPVGYICKYVSKLDGWSDFALSYIWINRTRLYSMSRDYILPDYSDKRVPEWSFRGVTSRNSLASNFDMVMSCFDTLLGADDIVELILKGGLSL